MNWRTAWMANVTGRKPRARSGRGAPVTFVSREPRTGTQCDPAGRSRGLCKQQSGWQEL